MTAGIDFGAAFFINAFLNLQFGFDAPRHWAHDPDLRRRCCCCTALLNQFGVRLVALLNNISVWWHVIGVLVIVRRAGLRAGQPPVGVVRVRPLRQQHRLGSSTFYVALIGLLLAQYTFTGYDASAHMTEETQRRRRAAARAAS